MTTPPSPSGQEAREYTWPVHDCNEILHQHFHNQDNAQWTACGTCNRIVAFQWKSEADAIAQAVEGERERCAAWIMAEGDRLKDMTPDERPFAVQALWNAAAALRAPGERA